MDTTKHIQTLAKLQVLTLVTVLITSSMLETSLPPTLQDYLAQEENMLGPVPELFILFIGGPLFITFIASFWGLLTIRPWAKKAYIYSNIGFILLNLFLPPFVTDSLSGSIGSVGEILTGMTIALLCFTPSAFTPRSNETLQESQVS